MADPLVLDNTYNNKIRNSNLELFRIIVMFFVVLHHYVINSGLLGTIFAKPVFLLNDYLVILLAGFGKIGINCFVLITGYFMCTSKITGRKYFKLLLEVMFYKIAIYVIFLIFGYETLSGGAVLRTFLPITSLSDGFTDCFLVFYLTIPFLNILVNNMDKRMHLLLNVLLLVVYSLFVSLPWMTVRYNYLTWFVVLYFIASYIRKYPVAFFENKKVCGIAAALLFGICLLSIAGGMYGVSKGFAGYSKVYTFVSDCPKPLAVAFSVTAFCFFKNINLKRNKFINTVSATTFGILLIHSNSDAMRQWLWQDLLRVKDHADCSLNVLYMLACCVGVFIVCCVIDILRTYIVENPLLKIYDSLHGKISSKR